MSAADTAIMDMGIIDASTDTSTVDTTTVDTPEVDTGAETADTPEANATEDTTTEDTPEVDTPETETQTDKDTSKGPVLPKEITAALNELKQNNPKVARALRDAFFSQQAYVKEFKSVKELQSFKQFIAQNVPGADWNNPDSVHEAISTLNESVRAIEAADEQVFAGDPAVVDNVLSDLREAGKLDSFAKLGEAFLERMKEATPDHYYNLAKLTILNGLDEIGMGQALNNMWAALNSGKIEDAKAALKSIAGWINTKGFVRSSDGKAVRYISWRR
jgi:hypothetical protein